MANKKTNKIIVATNNEGIPDTPEVKRIKKIVPNENTKHAQALERTKRCKSAMEILTRYKSKANFINAMQEGELNITPAELGQIYDNAENVKNWLNKLKAKGIIAGDEKMTNATSEENSESAFHDIISYVNLFPQKESHCCQECSSNQSPAAFYMELMNIHKAYVHMPDENEKLSLKTRREDLALLPLNCDSNVEVPYLEIANNILNRHLGDNAAELIARGTFPIKKGVQVIALLPFIPYNQPQWHMRSILEAAGSPLKTVARFFSKNQMESEAWVYETLGLCRTDIDVLKSENNLPKEGITPKEFRDLTGLSKAELELLVYQNLSIKERQVEGKFFQRKLFINVKIGNGYPLEIADKETTFLSMTKDIMYQIRCFMILANGTGWSFTELNYILTALGISDFKEPLPSLKMLARIKFISTSLRLAPLDVLACIKDIPTSGAANGKFPAAPFDIIFNPVARLKAAGGANVYHPRHEANPLYSSEPLQWQVNFGANTISEAVEAGLQHQLQQVLAGIPCSPLEAMLIARRFKLVPDSISKLPLSVENLSILYAHATIAAKLELPVSVYLDLFHFRFPPSEDSSKRLNLDQVFKLICLKEFLSSVAFPLYEYVSVLHMAKTIKESPVKDDVREFVINLRAKLKKTREGILIKEPQTKLDVELHEIQVEEIEMQVYVQWIHETAVFFGCNENVLRKMMDGLSQLQEGQNPKYLNVFIERPESGKKLPEDGVIEEISKAFQSIVPHLLCIQKAGLTDAQVAFVYHKIARPQENKPPLPLDKLTDVTIENILHLKYLLLPYESKKSDDFLKLLASGALFSEAFLSELEKITGWHKTAVLELKNRFYQDKDINACIRLLIQIQECFTLAKQTRFDKARLALLADLIVDEKSWEVISGSAKQLRDITHSKYDNDEWNFTFRESWGKQLEKDRDVLLPIVTYKLKTDFPDIVTHDHVADYFLCDVNMSGKMDISPMREALNAIQTYLQRCRTGLEKIDKKKLSGIHFSVWEWIPNYALWRANQKINQYPENYIQADLRTNETDLFKKFRNSIEQQHVTSDTIDTAFKDYLNEWRNLSDLVIMDACQYKVFDTRQNRELDRLFIFGRNEKEPNTYYYNTEDNYGATKGAWGQWKKIGIPIKSDVINSVYVFNRLFVFWTEQSSIIDTDPTVANANAKYTMYSLKVKYTYQDFNGNWVAEQTLSEFPFYLETSNEKSSLIKEGVNGWKVKDRELGAWKHFFPSKPHWRKISLTPLQLKRSKSKNEDDFIMEDYLMIFLGPVVGPSLKNFRAEKDPSLKIVGDFDKFFKHNKKWADQVGEISDNEMISPVSPFFLNKHLEITSLFRDDEKYSFIRQVTREVFINIMDQVVKKDTLCTTGINNFIGYNYDDSSYISTRVNHILTFPSSGKSDLPDVQRLEPLSYFYVRNRPMAICLKFKGSVFLYRDSLPQNFNPVIQIEQKDLKQLGQNNWAVFIANKTNVTDITAPSIIRISSGAIRFLEKEILDNGLTGLLMRKNQEMPTLNTTKRSELVERDGYQVAFPTISCNEQVDFEGPFGLYASELFFHAPALVASVFNKNMQYPEAQKWWQFIFNPIGVELKDKQKAWQFLPFHDYKPGPMHIDLWKLILLNTDPHNPDRIAALKPETYMKWVVMQYLDNLIAWGDMEFGTDTWESLNAATLLYFEAEDLLGKKPKKDSCSTETVPGDLSFENIEKPSNENPVTIDEKLEDRLPNLQAHTCSVFHSDFSNTPFCHPANDQLEAYWGLLEDRLFKLRNGLNLQGQTVMPALYGQLISPLLMAGNDQAGDTHLVNPSALGASLPVYRFKTGIGNALMVAEMVSQFGAQLLSALQQQDSEALQAMQATQESVLLNMISQTMQQTVDEAQLEIAALAAGLKSANQTKTYYNQLITSGLNSYETMYLDYNSLSVVLTGISGLLKLTASPVHLIPTVFGLADGSFQPGSSIESVAGSIDSLSQISQTGAAMSAARAEHQRRAEEWKNQLELANFSIEQINNQIEGASVRFEMAKSAYKQHVSRVQFASEIQDYLSRKYTNKEMYNWMARRIASLYFDAYQLVLSMAYSTQKAYQYELCVDDQFIKANAWDGLRKGLLAGESLKLSLMQMQKNYFDKNRRGVEVEKVFSLKNKTTAPAWKHLIEKGSLEFGIVNGDLLIADIPGSYVIIKTVCISIPAVVGPYQTFDAVLEQKSNRRAEKEEGMYGPLNQKIVISKGIEDSGMFLLDLNDERYLPFEGTGAISDWKFTLAKKDMRENLSDIIFTLKYVIR